MRRQTDVQPDVGAFHYPVLGLAFRSKRDKEGQWVNCLKIIYWNFKVDTLILDTVSLRASSWCAEDSAYRRIFVNTIFFSLSCFFFKSWTISRTGTNRSTSSGISAWCWWCGWWLASIGEDGTDQVLPFPWTGPEEYSELDPVPWRELPWGRLELREKDLENALPWFPFLRRRRRRWARSWKLGRDWAQVCGLWRHARYGIAGQLARHGGMIRLGFWSHNRWRIHALLAHLIYKLAQILEFIFLKRIRSVKFSVKASTIYKCMFTFISAVIVSDCKRLVMLAKDCSKAATTWAWKTIQPIK